MQLNGHKHTTLKERRIIHKKRRQLRKDLKRRGFKDRESFEITAQEMGLVYSDGGLLWPFWGLVRWLGGSALLWAALAALMLALIGYGYSKMFVDRSDFTIRVSGGLMRKGFQLCDTEDFEDPQVRILADTAWNCNAMSIQDLPRDLDQAEGAHNGDTYFAYTFWVRNAGEEPLDYEWYMRLNQSTQNVESALWIMIYDEGRQTVYTAYTPDGQPEHLSGYAEYPFRDSAADPDTQYYLSAAGKPGIRPTAYDPTAESHWVTSGIQETFQPLEKHRYTVVMWLEGDDPECTNALLGAETMFDFNFRVVGEEDDGIFGDVMDFGRSELT